VHFFVEEQDMCKKQTKLDLRLCDTTTFGLT